MKSEQAECEPEPEEEILDADCDECDGPGAIYDPDCGVFLCPDCAAAMYE